MANDLEARMADFLRDVGEAMGLALEVTVEPIDDGTRITVAGAGCEVFVQRRAAGLDALQHIVNAVFRREHPGRHIVVDCLDYRRNQDAELRETAHMLAERARSTRAPQEIGPLNPYARRIVHLALADDPGVTTESRGDAFLKPVVITASE